MSENGATDAGVGHNSNEIRTIIRQASSAIAPIEADIESLQADIRALKKKITKIKREQVFANGIAARDFDYWREVYEALNAEGDDAADRREKALASIRACADALTAGQTVDFIEVLQEAPEPEPDLELIEKNGKKAGKKGAGTDENPYDKDTISGLAWFEGWKKGQAELAAKMGNQEAVEASQSAAE